jgi:imidazolonepropionase-like amidohydrolase
VQDLLVRAPLAWIGRGDRLEDAAVATAGGAVTFAGARTEAPEAREVLDIDGFLMPAVADRHVHIALSDPAAVVIGGVSAVRDLAWAPDAIFGLAEASELPTFNGPLIRAAGPMLTGPGGYPTRESWAPAGAGREIRGVDDAAAIVDELADRGATAIKISLNAEAGATPSDAELTAICGAAQARGLPVTAHAQGTGQVERGLGAGLDELAHTPFTDMLSERVVDLMARSLRVVSTLGIHVNAGSRRLPTALDNLRRFRDAGGTVIYGTDLGNGDVPPGIDVREARLLVEAGLSPEELLVAMTRGPLRAGAPADLIGLTRSPLEELDALRGLLLVVRGGRIVFSREVRGRER